AIYQQAQDTSSDRGGQLRFQTSNSSGVLTDAVTINKFGFVGVGTTSPSRLFTIEATSPRAVIRNSGTSGDGYLLFGDADSDASGGIRYDHSTDSLTFRTAGIADRVVVNSSGAVGIGTTTPGTKLDVYSGASGLGRAAAGGITLESNTHQYLNFLSTANAQQGIVFGAGNLNNEARIIWEDGTRGNFLDVSGGTTVSINGSNGGYVGIGTSSPTQKLEVAGATQIDGNLRIRSATGLGNLTISDNGGGTATISNTGNSFLDIKSTVSTYFSTGNVGIGTTTPSAKLDVEVSGASGLFVDHLGSSSGDLVAGSAFAVINAWSNTLPALGVHNAGTGPAAYFDGNVGIGTTTPGAGISGTTLEVNGYVSTANNKGLVGRTTSGTATTLMRISSSNNSEYYSVADTIFYNSSSEKLRILNNGNVGIGTTSPLTKLTVTDNNANLEVSGSSNAIYDGVVLEAIDRQGTGRSDLNLFTGAGSLKMFTNSTERLRITNSGNVGIGTTSPSQSLSVQGNGLFSGNVSAANITATGTVNTAYASTTQLTTTGNTYLATSGGKVGIRTANPDLYNGFDFVINGRSLVTSGKEFYLEGNLTSVGNTQIGDSSSDALSFYTSTWSVYNSPNLDLETNTSALKFDTDLMDLDTLNRRVGIGTTTPSEMLQLNGSGGGDTPRIKFTNGSTGHSSADGAFMGISNSTQFDIWNFESNAVRIGTANSERIRIDASGNIGIGTTTPSSKLEVFGGSVALQAGAGFDTLRLNSSSAGNGTLVESLNAARTNYSPFNFFGSSLTYTNGSATRVDLTVNSSGNVGIGTSSPSAKLDIFSGTAAADTFAYIGGSAGERTLKLGVDSTGSNTYAVIQGISRFDSSARDITLQPDGGNVGIGTTTPAIWSGSSNRVLSISGSSNPGVALENTSANSQYFVYVDGGSSFHVRDSAAAASRLTISSGGNVGIGTTSPDSNLSISGGNTIAHISGGGVGLLNIDGGSATQARGVQFGYRGGGASQFSIGQNGTTGSTRLGFFSSTISSDALRMVIDSSGNVGIGTTSPLAKLDVYSTTDNAASTVRTDNAGLDITHANDTAGNFGLLRFRNWGSNGSLASSDGTYIQSLTNANNDTDLAFGNYVSGGTVLEAMRIKQNGNVGIGTSTPQSMLHLWASNNTPQLRLENNANGDSGWMTFYANNTRRGYIQYVNSTGALTLDAGGSNAFAFTNGNVGIGTTSPRAKLQVTEGGSGAQLSNNYDSLFVENSGTGGITIGTPSSATGLLAFADPGSSIAGYLGYDHANDSMSLGTGGSTRFTVMSAGNVGIGTTSPVSRLHVVDSSTTGQITLGDSTNNNYLRILSQAVLGQSSIDSTGSLLLRTNGSTEVMRLTSGGNVGIGTTSPATTLSIAGSEYLTGGIGVGVVNTTAGSIDALGTINTSGTTGGYKINGTLVLQASSTNYSTLVGEGAGAALKANNIFNTAVGYHALSNGSVSSNTAIGSYALGLNTVTGGSNTALGSHALYSNTSGSDNIALGDQALYDNLSGNSNIAVGSNALGGNSSGYFNVASGDHAMQNNSTGYGNASMGAFSLWLNAGGIENAAVGYNALFNNTGSHNAGFGGRALKYNTTGSSTTAVGYNAGSFIANGVTHNSISDNSLFLGANSMAQASGDTNEVVIGYNAIGNGSNSITLGNSSITKTVIGGNVGIGTTSPAAKLSLYGSSSGTTDNGVLNVSVNGGGSGDSGLAIGYDTSNNWSWIYSRTAGISQRALNINNGNLYLAGSGGTVGIGTTTPTSGLTVSAGSVWGNFHLTSTAANGESGIEIKSADDASGGAGMWLVGKNFGGLSSDQFSIYNSGSNKFVIDTAGNVGIGTSLPQRALHVYRSSDGPPVRFEDANGYCEIDPTSTSWICTSDRTLKKEINSIDTDETLARLAQLQAVSFRWNKDESTDPLRYGFIAQDVEVIFPELVSTAANGIKSVAYGGFTPFIIEGVKALKLSVDDLSKRVTDVEARLAALERAVGTSAATSTVPTATTTETVATQNAFAEWLSSMGVTIESAIMHVTDLIASAITADTITVNNLTAGNAQNFASAGITTFDRVTGQAYCMFIANGQVQSSAGSCDNPNNPANMNNGTGGTVTGDPTDGIVEGTGETNTGTSTPVDNHGETATSTPLTTATTTETVAPQTTQEEEVHETATSTPAVDTDTVASSTPSTETPPAETVETQTADASTETATSTSSGPISDATVTP
ncbi:MAG TPA: tail fiber domain-containing protein, partial [Candidatus Paceibacterota bacterium]